MFNDACTWNGFHLRYGRRLHASKVDEEVLQMTSRLGSCGICLPSEGAWNDCGDARISDAGHVLMVAIKHCTGEERAVVLTAVATSSLNAAGHAAAAPHFYAQAHNRNEDGPAAHERGFRAPTRALPLARFLEEGVSLISYSWLGGHHTPQTPSFCAHPHAAQHCPQL
jgi:hypothetical protein